MTESKLNASRVPVLDGIRGIAILLVFGVHTTPAFLAGGHVGVDLFFVLSGFLISTILLREYRKTGAINLGRFYLRRALRLLPALFIAVLAVLAFVALVRPRQLGFTTSDAEAIALYFFNWVLVAADPVYRDHQAMFIHLWSLSVEEQFYIVWPILTLGLLSLGAASRRVAFGLLAFGIVAPALAKAMLWPGGASLGLYFRTDLRFDGLMWGAMVAWILDTGWTPASDLQRRVLGWAAAVAGIGLVAPARFELLNSGVLYLGGFSLVGLLSSLLIAGAVLCPPPPFRKVLERPWLCWVGRISYGLYLWHVPFWVLSRTFGLGVWDRNIVQFGLTFLAATLSWYLVERHFLALKERIGHATARGRVKPPLSAAAPATTPSALPDSPRS